MFRTLFVILLLLAVIAGFAGYFLFRSIEAAKVDAARVQMKVIEQAVDAYHLNNGEPPADLEALVKKGPKNDVPYLRDKKALLDPWGKPYQYTYDKEDGTRIWTRTPDGQTLSSRPLPKK